MKKLLLFCFWLSSFAISSQNIVWEKTFMNSKSDNFACLRSTSDGGCIWGATIFSSTVTPDGNFASGGTRYDCWIKKLNSNGDTEWEKKYGGFADEFLEDIQCTADGGYVLC